MFLSCIGPRNLEKHKNQVVYSFTSLIIHEKPQKIAVFQGKLLTKITEQISNVYD